MDKIDRENQKSRSRIASAKGRVKLLARLLRCATALRVTAPLGYGSSGWYDRKVPFRPVHTTRSNPTTRTIHPLSLVNSTSLQIGPEQSRARSGAADP